LSNQTIFGRLTRHASRIKEILGVFAKYGLGDWIRDFHPEFMKARFKTSEGEEVRSLTKERRIRMALTELGTTFIKMGQMLSTRSDLAGPELAKELSHLQADTPADPPETVRAVIEAELGADPDELFAEFHENALASASIGQVHTATLESGEPVVVKVQHEGIEAKILVDLEILEWLAGRAEKSDELRNYKPSALAAEFRRTLLRELDFTRELRSLEAFAKAFADDPTVRFPRPWPERSSRRVLTMEKLDGVSVANSESLAVEAVDRAELAKRGANLWLEMIFRDGFYHADPHPGNILVMPGNVLGVLDCGKVGRLDEGTRELFEDLLVAAVEKDEDRLTELLVKTGRPPAGFDRDSLRSDVGDFLGEYVGSSLEGFDMSGCLEEAMALVRRHAIRLPPGLTMLVQVLVLLEGTSRHLSRDFSLVELLETYYQKAVMRRLSPKRLLGRARRSARDWERLISAFPRDMTTILERLRDGTLDVKLEHRRIEASTNRIVYGILSAALFLGSAMLLSSNTRPTIGGFSILGGLGAAAALVLALRLTRAITRSGGLDRKD